MADTEDLGRTGSRDDRPVDREPAPFVTARPTEGRGGTQFGPSIQSATGHDHDGGIGDGETRLLLDHRALGEQAAR